MSGDFERCEHGVTGAYCPDCARAARPHLGHAIIAGRAGDCQCCGFRFPAGTSILWVDDGDRILGWVAERHLTRVNTEPLLRHDVSCDRTYCHPSCPIQAVPHPERTP